MRTIRRVYSVLFASGCALLGLGAVLGIWQSWRVDRHLPALAIPVTLYDGELRDLLNEKDVDRLIDQARLAQEINPFNQDQAFHYLGMAYVLQGNYPAALACFERHLQSDPDSVFAHYNLALTLQNLGRVEEAIEHYRWAVDHDPGYTRARANLGILLADRGRVEEARPMLERALKDDPRLESVRRALEKLDAAGRGRSH